MHIHPLPGANLPLNGNTMPITLEALKKQYTPENERMTMENNH